MGVAHGRCNELGQSGSPHAVGELQLRASSGRYHFLNMLIDYKVDGSFCSAWRSEGGDRQLAEAEGGLLPTYLHMMLKDLCRILLYHPVCRSV